MVTIGETKRRGNGMRGEELLPLRQRTIVTTLYAIAVVGMTCNVVLELEGVVSVFIPLALTGAAVLAFALTYEFTPGPLKAAALVLLLA